MKKSTLPIIAVALMFSACGVISQSGTSESGARFEDNIYSSAPTFRSKEDRQTARNTTDDLIERTRSAQTYTQNQETGVTDWTNYIDPWAYYTPYSIGSSWYWSRHWNPWYWNPWSYTPWRYHGWYDPFYIGVFLVVSLKWGAFGKLLAPFVTNLTFFLYCLYKYRNILHHKFEWDRSKKIIIFCIPLTLAAMLTFFTGGYDRVLLERIGNVNELGYYVVGIQIAQYIYVFQTSIGSTFQPDLFQAIIQKDSKKLTKVITMLIGSTAFVVFIFILLAPIIIDLLTAGRYNESVKYAQIAALSTLTSAMYYTV